MKTEEREIMYREIPLKSIVKTRKISLWPILITTLWTQKMLIWKNVFFTLSWIHIDLTHKFQENKIEMKLKVKSWSVKQELFPYQ